jgi:hypothetical protein
MSDLPKRRRVLTKIKLTEISGVDRPCQEGAKVAIMKRDEPPEDTAGLERRLAVLRNVMKALAQHTDQNPTISKYWSAQAREAALAARKDHVSSAAQHALGAAHLPNRDPAQAAHVAAVQAHMRAAAAWRQIADAHAGAASMQVTGPMENRAQGLSAAARKASAGIEQVKAQANAALARSSAAAHAGKTSAVQRQHGVLRRLASKMSTHLRTLRQHFSRSRGGVSKHTGGTKHLGGFKHVGGGRHSGGFKHAGGHSGGFKHTRV